jgi:hypothetical protein
MAQNLKWRPHLKTGVDHAKRIQLVCEHDREEEEGDRPISAAEMMSQKEVSCVQEVSTEAVLSSVSPRVQALQLQPLAGLKKLLKLADAESDTLWTKTKTRSRHS